VVSEVLRIERWQLRNALHRIKEDAGFAGADRVTIWDDGTVTDTQGSQLGTSTIASGVDGTVKTYAILSFAGEQLDPCEISSILSVAPTRAYRKGEEYFAGPRTGMVKGRTGIWLLSTDELVDSPDLDQHISYLVKLIFEDDRDRPARLQQLIVDRGLKAHVSCFWHGKAGAPAPKIPAFVINAFEHLPAAIETDFDTD